MKTTTGIFKALWTIFVLLLLGTLLPPARSQMYIGEDDDGSGEASGSACVAGPWSDWGACARDPPCKVYVPHEPASFDLGTASNDVGRSFMGFMRRMKYREQSERERCQDSGTCPENLPRPSTGPQDCEDGMAGDYPCHNIDMLSYLNFASLGYGTPLPTDRHPIGNDCWGWTDPETGDEYAIAGLSGGTSFVRITDPTNPVVLGFLPTRTGPSIWRDIKVINNTAYIGSEARRHGVQVVDLLQFRDQTEFRELSATTEYTQFGNSHNLVSNEETQFIYGVGCRESYIYGNRSCRGGLHFIDVSRPLEPRFAGCYSEDGYTHDAQCVIYRGPDRRYYGREVCFAYNEDSLTIVDVTSKQNPTMISKKGYTNCKYSHQGWITEDHTTLLLDDELDEYFTSITNTQTYIWDIKDLENPILKNVHSSSQTSIDHNQYILGDYTYQSNYAAGLRILAIDEVNYALHEVAHFDVYPSSTRVAFKGTWSNYPYYKSGVVALTSIEYGLYIVKPRLDAMAAEATSAKMIGEQVRTRNVTSSDAANGECPAVQTRPCVPEPCNE